MTLSTALIVEDDAPEGLFPENELLGARHAVTEAGQAPSGPRSARVARPGGNAR